MTFGDYLEKAYPYVRIPGAVIFSAIAIVQGYDQFIGPSDMGPAVKYHSAYVTSADQGEITDYAVNVDKLLDCEVKLFTLTMVDANGRTYTLPLLDGITSVSTGEHLSLRWAVRLPYTAASGLALFSSRVTHHNCPDGKTKITDYDFTYPTLVGEKKSTGGKGRTPKKRKPAKLYEKEVGWHDEKAKMRRKEQILKQEKGW